MTLWLQDVTLTSDKGRQQCPKTQQGLFMELSWFIDQLEEHVVWLAGEAVDILGIHLPADAQDNKEVPFAFCVDDNPLQVLKFFFVHFSCHHQNYDF